MGYRADVVSNGLEVLEAVKRQSYDVVLMDIQMPEMDGVQATHHLHEQYPPAERPRIVALTANALSGDKERYLAMGMDDYISKPIRVDELVNALRRCQPLPDQEDETLTLPKTPDQSPEFSTAAVIDSSAIEELRTIVGEDGADVIIELIGTFLDDTPNRLVDLRQAVDQGDAELIRRTAHTLKSNSATFGALHLASICKELEVRGRSGIIEGAAERATQIELEYEKVKAVLEKECLKIG
jgi:CheY-like chemotaxis protein/HPt (histidine-containing phosphotransfer) domain-containing protein